MFYDDEVPALTREEVEAKRHSLASLVPQESSNHPLKLHILASGSKGNASVIECSSTGQFFVIDCGISCKRFLQALHECHLSLENLMGIVVTHEHTDHTKGLPVLYKTLVKQGRDVALYVNDQVRQNSTEILSLEDRVEIKNFNHHSQLSFASIQVYPFVTSHDAAASFGFRIQYDDDVVGFVTDTGMVSDEMISALHDARILGLEANHDALLLKNGSYPHVVKKRIASDRGHLSNVQASNALNLLLSRRLERVVALHVSESNNTYRLPVEVLQGVLSRNDHSAQVYCGFQNRTVSL